MSRQPRVHPQLRVIATPSATRLETCVEMFMLHQEASRHTPRTQEFYRYTLGGFLSFLEGEGVETPEGIKPRHIRKFIVAKQRQGCKDTTVHGYARAIKAFCNFLVVEGCLKDSPMRKVTMPKLEKEIHPPFAREDVEKLLKDPGARSGRLMRRGGRSTYNEVRLIPISRSEKLIKGIDPADLRYFIQVQERRRSGQKSWQAGCCPVAGVVMTATTCPNAPQAGDPGRRIAHHGQARAIAGQQPARPLVGSGRPLFARKQ